MIERLKEIRAAAEEKIMNASDLDSLREVKVKTLGRKGEITVLLRGLKDLAADERAETGKVGNEIKQALEQLIEEKIAEIKQREMETKLAREKIDISLPGTLIQSGSLHPLSRVANEIKDIFIGMGFSIAEGPEIEYDYYNFEALNIPKDHPARDMQDSFYISDDILLRTHTSPMQVRVMEKTAPQTPVKIIVPGKVYRRDDDATHSPMVHQVEGLVIDESITFGHLKGTLLAFAERIFEQELQVRSRPSFFPFTEPSAEMDISCVNCKCKGCRVCSYSGWLEILGAGMVNPKVLENGGYDPEKVTGFAFGLGIERIAMLKYGINDLRLFYDNDKRFLAQF